MKIDFSFYGQSEWNQNPLSFSILKRMSLMHLMIHRVYFLIFGKSPTIV
jgi:hypothetical protein